MMKLDGNSNPDVLLLSPRWNRRVAMAWRLFSLLGSIESKWFVYIDRSPIKLQVNFYLPEIRFVEKKDIVMETR